MPGSVGFAVVGDKFDKLDKSDKLVKLDKFACVVPAWSGSDYKSGLLLLLASYGIDINLSQQCRVEDRKEVN